MRRTRTVVALAVLVLLPRAVSAQSAIAGLATDTSGAVVPGVTVEATSPALIEKVRTVVTDAQGRYAVVDLRPGIYAMTFSLPGFVTIHREKIEVPSNTTVPINVKLELGAVNETITVSGQTPMVDVQAATRQAVLSKTVLDSLPTSRNYLAVGAVVSGVRLHKPDMGGTNSIEQLYVTARGRNVDQNASEVDGMDARSISGGQLLTNFGMVQEVTYQTSGAGADTQAGGVRINMIPHDGGNTFNGEVYFTGGNHHMQSNNITPELVRRGLKTPTATDSLYDFNPALGGPLMRDRLWFYASFRRVVLNRKPAGSLYPDAIEDAWINNVSERVTWQVSERNKLTGYQDRAFKFWGHDFTIIPAEAVPGGIDPETGTTHREPKFYALTQAKWTSTLSSRLLFEAGISVEHHNWSIAPQPGVEEEAFTPAWYAKAPRLDFVRGTVTTAAEFGHQVQTNQGYMPAASLRFVTGSHNFKAGFQGRSGPSEATVIRNGDLIERFRDGVADAVDATSTPNQTKAYRQELAFYGQDAWTIKRLTVNAGVRFERQVSYLNPVTVPAGRFVPARTVPRTQPQPADFDIAPRVSVVYDLFGDARTALKVSAGKFMEALQGNAVNRYSPIVAQSDRRNWFDCGLVPGTSTCSGVALPTNGDKIAQDNEIGPSNITGFGFSTNRRPDPNLRRVYTWDTTVSVQHQLLPRLSVTGEWSRTTSHRLEKLINTALSVSDYSSFQVANPLGNGEMITIYNLNRNKQGIVSNMDSNSDINGRIYNGFDVSTTARLPNGGTIVGGWSTDRLQTVTCDTNNPNLLRFCDQTGTLYQELGGVSDIPYLHELKLSVTSPLPWNLEVGVTSVSYPGLGNEGGSTQAAVPSLRVNWTPAASLFPEGRTQAVTVPLIPPGTKYLDRWNQVDVTLKKIIRSRQMMLQPQMEIYNLFNASTVLSQNETFGPALDTPAITLQGRLLKLSVRMTF